MMMMMMMMMIIIIMIIINNKNLSKSPGNDIPTQLSIHSGKLIECPKLISSINYTNTDTVRRKVF
jgi:hypothetical protein